MGVDTHLYLNPKWELRDIITVLERTQKKPAEVKVHNGSLLGCYEFYVGKNKRRIFVIVNTDLPTGAVTYMSMNSDDESLKIFRDVAKVLGGILMERDSDGECEIIEGNMNEEDALPYFLKYAIVDKGIDPDDTQALLKVKKQWEKEIEGFTKAQLAVVNPRKSPPIQLPR